MSHNHLLEVAMGMLHELLERGCPGWPNAGRAQRVAPPATAVRLVRVGCGPRCRPACVRSLRRKGRHWRGRGEVDQGSSILGPETATLPIVQSGKGGRL